MPILTIYHGIQPSFVGKKKHLIFKLKRDVARGDT